ncbi:hypothetical protein [Lacisediminihabitans sp. H27-G8]|uniref:hypothetical protein n=1 Tax=Lacisediminihabitans sp. H27-G8 TaxID=3111909 RepID=UPI0038FC62B9
MVDTSPQSQNPEHETPKGGAPAAESTTAPIDHPGAETVPPSAAPVAAAAPRSKRGLILAGTIVAAVIVVGGIFGGGVLVGTSVGATHGIIDARQGPGGLDHRGDRGDGPATGVAPGTGTKATPPSGTRPDGGQRGGSDGTRGPSNG